MGSVRHLVSEVEGSGALLVAGHLRWNGTTSALSVSSKSTPLFFADDITAYKLATGVYQVNIQNFRSPNGIVVPVCTVGSSAIVTSNAATALGLVPLAISVGAGSYTTGTDTYGFVVSITSSLVFTDADVNFMVFGF